MFSEQTSFERKIEQEIAVEPKDWMPDGYRKTLVRQSRSACSLRGCRNVARSKLVNTSTISGVVKRYCLRKFKTKLATVCICTARQRP